MVRTAGGVYVLSGQRRWRKGEATPFVVDFVRALLKKYCIRSSQMTNKDLKSSTVTIWNMEKMMVKSNVWYAIEFGLTMRGPT
jgi:hypothetical protein